MQSWECSRCTYKHLAHAVRCVMCNELRISKEQMRNFITNSSGTCTGNGTKTITTKSKNRNKRHDTVTAAAASIDDDDDVVVVNDDDDAVPTVPLHHQQQRESNASTSNKENTNCSHNHHRPQHHYHKSGDDTNKKTNAGSAQSNSTYNPYTSKQQQQQTFPLTNPNRFSRADPAVATVATSSSSGVSVQYENNTKGNDKINNTVSNKTIIATGTGTATSVQQQQQQQQEKRLVPVKKRSSSNFLGAGNKKIVTVGSKSLSTIAKKGKKRTSLVVQYIQLPYVLGHVPYDTQYMNTWIYPVVDSYPKRQYQYDITCTAIQHNTLVSLPTGLGKTLIASVVLFNFYRWFPTGKVLFLAPTLPLVDQQVQACYEIMGIPTTDTALLTGKVPATQRINIWKDRRVFFCTPQTVQRDLEAGRCNALQVVCVVLDEAHKSTGDYAYCKVISYLEKAGAKFRILGLSATPGTSIKAVQSVINVLRINRIEARCDTDPDVKQYIHERQTEVIVVKGMDTTKDVERILDEIISPILDTLRKRNAILGQHTANYKSINLYSLLKSQSFILSQQPNERDNGAIGYLSAGICFVQIRTDLHKHGIGMVRNKIQKLQMDKPRGPLSTIVKGELFQSLCNEVERVSCNPLSLDNTIEDKYKNNPKLKKLCEILMDHFERSNNEATSSRVIVFSQFRTSVSEIVNTLNESKPLIRARHFIGQGKSGTTTTARSKSNDIIGDQQQQHEQLMDGMKQDEQKNVIERFKEGVYNTLVCTSIGEEGLDIGEVDLIVNFDCLSSPIRTIQRVGRTGRKREGRVVTLVAEGHEERTLAQSKQNERTLIHALKDPNSFEVLPTRPMLPNEPVVLEQDMAISQSFVMSQVNGVKKKIKKKSKQLGENRSWKLNETEDFQRSCALGYLSSKQNAPLLVQDNDQLLLSTQLRRRFLNARNMSLTSRQSSSRNSIPHGKLCSLIGEIEALHPIPARGLRLNSYTKVNGSIMDKLFPLSRPQETQRILDREKEIAKTTTNELNDNSDNSKRPSLRAADDKVTPSESLHTMPEQSMAEYILNRTIPNRPISQLTGSKDIPTGNGNDFDNAEQYCSDICTDTFKTMDHGRIEDSESANSMEAANIEIKSMNLEELQIPPEKEQVDIESEQSIILYRRKNTKRLAVDDTPDSIEIHQSIQVNDNKRMRRIIPTDTQDSSSVHVHASKLVEDNGLNLLLQDTQQDNMVDNFSCAICMSKNINEQNPIILCDGSSSGKNCNLIVHKNCYSAKCSVMDDVAWHCDQCLHVLQGGSLNSVKCYRCNKTTGILKKLPNSLWQHFTCTRKLAPIQTGTIMKKCIEGKASKHTSGTIESPSAILHAKRLRRQMVMQQFIDYEADGSDTEDDDNEEEMEVLAIEDEEDELAKGFINDTSQLGYSPDNLDAINGLASEQSEVVNIGFEDSHRALDMERAKHLQFATPLLNRRMLQSRDSCEGNSNAPDSARGLGKMNFVRSVLEHHRRGGNINEIEEFYNEMEVADNEM